MTTCAASSSWAALFIAAGEGFPFGGEAPLRLSHLDAARLNR